MTKGTLAVGMLAALLSGTLRAATFDGSGGSLELPEQGLAMPKTRPQPKPKVVKGIKGAKPAAAAIAPEFVSDVAAFALTPAQIKQLHDDPPSVDSPLAKKLLAIMHRAYVGGENPAPFKGDSLRVITWNINAALSKEAVAAVVAAADNDPEGVKESLGRTKVVTAKAVAQLSKIGDNDVFLMQEIPLPTAIELARHLKAQVFWVPEWLEVGDNAKGRDPEKGENYTGNAIISRVPISDYRVLRFANQTDWYETQKGPKPLGDILAKTAAKVLFAADAGNRHQTRPAYPYGGRMALFAKTSVFYHAQGVTGKNIWVGDLHLEDQDGPTMRGPDLRLSQERETRQFIASVDGPVLFGGDLNTMGSAPGVTEGEDMAIEGPDAMHASQAPVKRQSGYANGTGDKFFGVIDAADLGTTLTHHPQKRPGLVAKQTFDVAVDIAPYAPTAHDIIDSGKRIGEQPKNVPRDLYYAGMAAADMFPYTAVGAKGFQIFWDERSRHNPTAKANADHNLFTDVKKELGAQILNPTLGFRFGMGGYPATWTAGRPFMIPGLSKGLANAVTDWLFLRDPDHQLQAKKGEVLKDAVEGTKAGSADSKKLSDHYPLRAEVPLE